VPTSPADGEDLARAVARIYEDAERALLGILAQALAEGIDSPRWAELKLAAIGNVRTALEHVTDALQTDADGAIRRAITEAYERGTQSAIADLGALDEGRRAFVAAHLPGAHAVDRLANAAVDEQQPVYRRILREAQDVYRLVVGRVSGSTLLGSLTRRQTAQRALDQFAQRGVTGFTDRAGRHWEMASYAEMAVRSATGRAAIEGHIDALTALGEQLVIVSDAPLECPFCRPWEGEILSINGQSGPHTLRLPKADDSGGLFRRPETVAVHVAGSLVEARAQKLFHPNCRHSLSVYLPGVTRRPQSPPHPQGATYEDTQEQRRLERQVRAWKRRAAAALDDQARRRANAKVRHYQARVREHTAATGLRRKSEREQIGRAR
jgi:Phage minor capsid protein 2